MIDLIRQRLASRIVADPIQRAVLAALVDRATTSDLDGMYGTVTASLAHVSIWSHVGPVRAAQALSALRSAGVLIPLARHDGYLTTFGIDVTRLPTRRGVEFPISYPAADAGTIVEGPWIDGGMRGAA
ncbi:MAG: hypothetical protein M3440_06645 [Chloroflexota bacterium]|nr:hypothetical protein [Chloroflexota bacterium]